MGLLAGIKKLFGGPTGPTLGELIAQGAKIIDVRTPGEFAGGHVKGAINIPLNAIESSLGKFKKDQAIITCCASGMRSRSAKAMMQSNGFTNVHNGGSWYRVNQYKA